MNTDVVEKSVVLQTPHNTNHDDLQLDSLSVAQIEKNTRSAEKARKLAEINARARADKENVKREYMNDSIVNDDEKITAMYLEIDERKVKLQNKVNEYKFTGKLVNAASFSE